MTTSAVKPKLLLHACCAPCSPYVLQKLGEDYNLAVYYYNPNIQPEEEYQRRRDELKSYLQKLGIKFIEPGYEPREWREHIKGLENEPERGKRCDACFSLRLDHTAQYAARNGYDEFGTTLTLSRHKKAKSIHSAGLDAQARHAVAYHEEDFKKCNGENISTELSSKLGFYRQSHCGCEFSDRTGTITR